MATVPLPDVTWSDVNTVVNAKGLSASNAADSIEGAFNGHIGIPNTRQNSSDADLLTSIGFYSVVSSAANLPVAVAGTVIVSAFNGNSNSRAQIYTTFDNRLYFRSNTGAGWNAWVQVWNSGNTTVDGSGFIKEASPIIKLFSDKIEKNNLVSDEVTMTKNSVGDYTISGSLGFAQSGWYIEQPKDANGQVKHYIEYTQLENNEINIKVYTPDYSNGFISAGAPCDVVEGRWIDIRLQGESNDE